MISDTSKKEFLELIFIPSYQKIRQKYRREDLSSVSDPLACSLSIGVVKRSFFRI